MEASKTSRLSSNLSAPATKTCTRCKQEKNIEEFKFRYKAEGIRQPACHECSRAINRDHYNRNKLPYLERTRAQNKVKKEENRKQKHQYLTEHPCVNCGESDPVVLDFDHVERSNKKHNIAKMMCGYPWCTILLEIAKCQVLCANCHRRKTWAESH